MNIDAKKADSAIAGLDAGQQPVSPDDDSRKNDVVLRSEYEQAMSTQKGRLQALQAKLKEKEEAEEAARVKSLEEKQQYKELYEAIQEKDSQQVEKIQKKDAEIEELRSFKQRQIEESIKSMMSDIPKEDHEEHIDLMDGMSFEKKKKYLGRISKSINKKPISTPLGAPGATGVSKSTVDSIFDSLGVNN